jgi:toxin ParE1/3/4
VIRFEVTPPAQDHLVEIADYTREEWGTRQMSVYMNALNSRFKWLAANPQLGRPRPQLREDLRSYREGAHIVFYTLKPDWIDIVAVLHQLRDLKACFDDLA